MEHRPVGSFGQTPQLCGRSHLPFQKRISVNFHLCYSQASLVRNHYFSLPSLTLAKYRSPGTASSPQDTGPLSQVFKGLRCGNVLKFILDLHGCSKDSNQIGVYEVEDVNSSVFPNTIILYISLCL